MRVSLPFVASCAARARRRRARHPRPAGGRRRRAGRGPDALPEAALRAPGGEQDWNVAQAFAHTTAARRFLAAWAALDVTGEWPDTAPPGHAVDPRPRRTRSREELHVLLAKSRASMARSGGGDREARDRAVPDGPPARRAPAPRGVALLRRHPRPHAPGAAPPPRGQPVAPSGPAPLVLVVDPSRTAARQRSARTPRWRRPASACWPVSCSARLAAQGAAVHAPPRAARRTWPFHWGRWFAAAALGGARRGRRASGRRDRLRGGRGAGARR